MLTAPALLAGLLSFAADSGSGAAVPDQVRTKDGGVARGTIIEIVPGRTVHFQLPTGETRVFAMADVEYAGPAQPLARLRLVSPQARLTFHHKTGTSSGFGPAWMASGKSAGAAAAIQLDHFARLCTAPCSAVIPEGSHRLGLSLDDGTVVIAQAIDLRGSVEVEGHIVSRTSRRVAGGLLALGSAVGGYLLLIASGVGGDTGWNPPLYVGGLAVILIGTPVGIGIAFTPDRADVRLR